VTLNVALGNNVELSVFQVNGSDVVDGDVVDLDHYTTEVEVVFEVAEIPALGSGKLDILHVKELALKLTANGKSK
jgi:hypothetical protein